MSEQYHDESFDEHTIEISDLSLEDAYTTGTSPSLIRRISLGAQMTERQRRRRVIVTGGIVLAALLVFVSSVLFPARDMVLSKFFPSPAPKLLSGSDLFYFPTLPSWGRAMLDGKPLTALPGINDGLPLKLADGMHQIEWRAEPFQRFSCILSVPPAQATQTCLTHTLTDPNSAVHQATLVTFPTPISLNTLPQTQQQSLKQTVQRLLDTFASEDIVQPGERYLQSSIDDAVSTATGLLRARQRYLLETDTAIPAMCSGVRFDRSCFIADQDCRLFCTLRWPGSTALPAQARWDVAVIIRPLWIFSALEPNSGPDHVEVQGRQQFVTLQITWQQGSWHVAFHPQGESSFDDPNCITMIGTLLSDPAYSLTDRMVQPVHWTYYSGENRAQGCVAAPLSDDPSLAPVFSVNSSALIIQRFGVLLAANAVAERLWPQLPRATAEEQALALDIADHPAFIS